MRLVRLRARATCCRPLASGGWSRARLEVPPPPSPLPQEMEKGEGQGVGGEVNKNPSIQFRDEGALRGTTLVCQRLIRSIR